MTPSSPTVQATWFLPCTAMHHLSEPKVRSHAAISSCHPTLPTRRRTIALSSTFPSSSKLLCLWRQKQRLGHCTSTLAKQYPCTYSLQKWDISNHQRQPKPTTARHSEWSTATSNLGKQKPCICGFTGYVAVKPNNNSDSTGVPAKPAWETTGPNIIVLHTMSKNAAPS